MVAGTDVAHATRRPARLPLTVSTRVTIKSTRLHYRSTFGPRVSSVQIMQSVLSIQHTRSSLMYGVQFTIMITLSLATHRTLLPYCIRFHDHEAHRCESHITKTIKHRGHLGLDHGGTTWTGCVSLGGVQLAPNNVWHQILMGSHPTVNTAGIDLFALGCSFLFAALSVCSGASPARGPGQKRAWKRGIVAGNESKPTGAIIYLSTNKLRKQTEYRLPLSSLRRKQYCSHWQVTLMY
ncbi:hypothetical protein EDB89DRAFT_481979 [Lactarius sanguifluus]|nr:hypothetical protein EDB89DRAFT_481979 [Lactarius sanguifluus]